MDYTTLIYQVLVQLHTLPHSDDKEHLYRCKFNNVQI